MRQTRAQTCLQQRRTTSCCMHASCSHERGAADPAFAACTAVSDVQRLQPAARRRPAARLGPVSRDPAPSTPSAAQTRSLANSLPDVASSAPARRPIRQRGCIPAVPRPRGAVASPVQRRLERTGRRAGRQPAARVRQRALPAEVNDCRPELAAIAASRSAAQAGADASTPFAVCLA